MKWAKAAIAVGVIAAITLVAVIVGSGYADYNGNTYSENNTMDVAEDRVDLLKDDGGNYVLLNEKIVMPSYSAGSTVYITGYAVATSSQSGGVYVRCDMGNSACWALIDSMQITMGGNTLPFGKMLIDQDIVSGVPTASPMPMTNSTQITLGGKTLYYSAFTIEITFSDFDIGDDKNFETLAGFAGSSFVFTYVPE